MNAILLAVAAGLCWGVGEVFTRSVLHTGKVGPITAIAVRSTVALPVLWAAYFLAHRVFKSEPANWTSAPTPVLLKLVLGSGLVAGALAMICFYAALSMAEVSKIKPIAFCLAPAVGALLGWLALGESMTPRKAIGIAVVILGVLLIAGNGASTATIAPVAR